MITRKQEFKNFLSNIFRDGKAEGVTLVISNLDMKYPEEIFNPMDNLSYKLEYIDRAYDDDLCLKNNTNIRIDGYYPVYFHMIGTFGWALDALNRGEKVRRSGWNGKGQWIMKAPGYIGLDEAEAWSEPNKEAARLNGGKIDVLPYIALKNAQNKIIYGWVPSTGDLFGTDWEIAY